MRERRKKTVTVELSVPIWVLRVDKVSLRAQEREVRIGAPKDHNDSRDEDFCPVLLSGSFGAVYSVWKCMFIAAFPLSKGPAKVEQPSVTETTTTAPGQSKSKHSEDHGVMPQTKQELNLPEKTWQSLARNSVVEYYRQDFHVELTALEGHGDTRVIRLEGPVREVEKAAKQIGRTPSMKAFAKGDYIARMRFLTSKEAEVVLPYGWASTQLGCWEKVVRMRLHDDMSQELCLPASTWQTLAENNIVEFCRMRFSVEVEQGALYEDGNKQCVHLQGKDMNTQRAAKFLLKFKRRQSEQTEEALATRMQGFMDGEKRNQIGTGKLTEDEWKQVVTGKLTKQDWTRLVTRNRDSTPDKRPMEEKHVPDSQVRSKTAAEPIENPPVDQTQQARSAVEPVTSTSVKHVTRTEQQNIDRNNQTIQQDQQQLRVNLGTAVKATHNSDPVKQQKIDMHKTRQDPQRLGDDMRSALRHLTQPVALISSIMLDKSAKVTKGRPRGVTVSSFCTVTLSPVPIVSFNLRVPSRSWDAISSSGRLRVHLLRASPEGAAAAHAFTLPYEQPDEPFERLKQLGAAVFAGRDGRRTPPKISWENAVIADMSATLLPDKCIQVGDHMIVLAEVERLKWPRDHEDDFQAGALAYGKKGYRRLGEEVKPIERALEAATSPDIASIATEPVQASVPMNNAPSGNTVTDASAASDGTTTSSGDQPEGADASEEEPQLEEISTVDPPTASEPTEIASTGAEPIETSATTEKPSPKEEGFDYYDDEKDMNELFERFTAADEDVPSMREGKTSSQTADSNIQQVEAKSRDISDLGPSSPLMDDDSLRQVLNESETSYASEGLPSQAAAENPALAEALNAVAGAYKDAPIDIRSPKPSKARKKSKSPPNQPSASPQKVGRSDHAPFSKPEHRAWGLPETRNPTNRSFSSWTRMYARMYSTSSDKPDPPISDKILQTTVGDYLCEVPRHRKRYAALINTRRRTDRLQRQLETGDWTPEEATEMEDEIVVARNQIAKELATRNAHDLRAMLDLGRVNSARAQWLESNLEAGQAVLLAEAKLLRTAVYQGRLSAEEFEEKKAKITQDYEEIDTQLMRLKDFVDEDEFDGDGGGGVEGREESEEDDTSFSEGREEEPVDDPKRRGWGMDNSRWS